MGFKIILRSLNDGHLIQDAAVAANIIIHIATANYKPSIMSIFDSIIKSNKTNQIYIYINSCNAFIKANYNKSYNKNIYKNDKLETMDSIANDTSHRLINLAIFKRYRIKLNAKAKLFIVLSLVIYSINNANLLSIQVLIII